GTSPRVPSSTRSCDLTSYLAPGGAEQRAHRLHQARATADSVLGPDLQGVHAHYADPGDHEVRQQAEEEGEPGSGHRSHLADLEVQVGQGDQVDDRGALQ